VQNKLIHFVAHEKISFLIPIGSNVEPRHSNENANLPILAKKNLIKIGHIIHQNARQNTTNTMGVVKIDVPRNYRFKNGRRKSIAGCLPTTRGLAF
jgi:hypothetical protein